MGDEPAAEPAEPVLIGGIEKVEIRVVDYDPHWPDRFREHADRIRAALPPALPFRIEHIGSTAVPDLSAKPIIDILLTLPDPADEDAYLPALVAAGYQLRVRDPADEQHRMLRTPARDVHIHVYAPDAAAVGRYLALRDALRRDNAERDLYGRTKRRLAARDWPDMNAYADAKSEVITAILGRAKRTS